MIIITVILVYCCFNADFLKIFLQVLKTAKFCGKSL